MRARAFLKVVRNAFTSDLEYRSNYVILVLGTFITIFMELAVFKQIYRGHDVVEGLPRELVLSFILLGTLIRYGSQLWSLVGESIEEIRDGSFRKYLLQPVRYPAFFVAKVIGPKFTTWTLATLAILGFRQTEAFHGMLPSGAWVPFLAAIALSYAITWQIYLCLVYLGFWLEEATFLSTAFNIGVGFFSGTALPLAWLPSGLRDALAWTPFPLLGDFPLRAGLGLLSAEEFWFFARHSLGWMLALSIVIIALQSAGFRRYEAFGG